MQRPKKRLDCIPGGAMYYRPCPWATCKYHTLNEAKSCALDLAEKGPLTQKEVGEVMRVSKQAIDQMERKLFNILAEDYPDLREALDIASDPR